MKVINYALCIIFLVCLAVEVRFILKRNRTIQLKGRDDFLGYSLAVILVLAIFPLTDSMDLVENIRNILALVALFGVAGIKKGFSGSGMEKLFYTVPWDQIQEVHINAYQTTKIQVICRNAKGEHKLLFNKFVLKDVLRLLEKNVPNIYIQSSLEEVLSMKKG